MKGFRGGVSEAGFGAHGLFRCRKQVWGGDVQGTERGVGWFISEPLLKEEEFV